MKLTSEKKFDYKNSLGFYLPDLAGTDKENMSIEEILEDHPVLTKDHILAALAFSAERGNVAKLVSAK